MYYTVIIPLVLTIAAIVFVIVMGFILVTVLRWIDRKWG